MRTLHILFILFITAFSFAQNTGSITGKLIDKEYNNEPLPFANILIKETTTGTTSDIDGLYEFSDLAVGTYTLTYSFVGYQTIEKNIDIKAGVTLTVNQQLTAKAGVTLDEIQIQATVSKSKVSALLTEQKKAVAIKTTIYQDYANTFNA